MGKLEETFNLPETIASLEETAQNIIDQFDTDEPTEYDNLVNQYKDVITDITIDDLADIRIYDKEMDELSSKTLTLAISSDTNWCGVLIWSKFLNNLPSTFT